MLYLEWNVTGTLPNVGLRRFSHGKPELAAGVGVGQRASSAVLQHGLHLRVVPDLDEAAVEVLLQGGVPGPGGVGCGRGEGLLAAVADALGRQVPAHLAVARVGAGAFVSALDADLLAGIALFDALRGHAVGLEVAAGLERGTGRGMMTVKRPDGGSD